MVKDEEEYDIIKLRFGMAVQKLIDRNKKRKIRYQKAGKIITFDYSYGKIASSTGLRPATISRIVNGKADIKGTTLALLMKSLNVSMKEFGKYFDSIKDEELKSRNK